MKIQVKVGEQSFEVEVGETNARPIKAEIDGQTFEVWPEENQVVEVIPSQEAAPAPKAAVASVKTGTTGSAKVVTAPLPGVVDSIKAKPGDSVSPGQELLVLEAMKMKNSIKATRAGKIAAVLVSVGETVPHGAALVEFTD